ncbi:MAG: hypothetical protein WKG00_18125 [Polyangiaceae bacterium]
MAIYAIQVGVQRILHVWPARPSPAAPGDLLRATRRLVEEKLVVGACLFVVGDIDASPDFWMNDTSFIDGSWKQVPLQVGGVDPQRHHVVYQGYSVEDLLAAVERAPLGRDACVVFDGLDSRHPGLAAVFEKKRFFSGTVRLVELRAPKTFVVYDMYAEGDEPDLGEHEARRLFIVDGKSGPDSIKGTPLKPVLEELFGKRPKEACTQS